MLPSSGGSNRCGGVRRTVSCPQGSPHNVLRTNAAADNHSVDGRNFHSVPVANTDGAGGDHRNFSQFARDASHTIRRNAAEFFGVREDDALSERWTSRRKRLLSRRCGPLRHESNWGPSSTFERPRHPWNEVSSAPTPRAVSLAPPPATFGTSGAGRTSISAAYQHRSAPERVLLRAGEKEIVHRGSGGGAAVAAPRDVTTERGRSEKAGGGESESEGESGGEGHRFLLPDDDGGLYEADSVRQLSGPSRESALVLALRGVSYFATQARHKLQRRATTAAATGRRPVTRSGSRRAVIGSFRSATEPPLGHVTIVGGAGSISPEVTPEPETRSTTQQPEVYYDEVDTGSIRFDAITPEDTDDVAFFESELLRKQFSSSVPSIQQLQLQPQLPLQPSSKGDISQLLPDVAIAVPDGNAALWRNIESRKRMAARQSASGATGGDVLNSIARNNFNRRQVGMGVLGRIFNRQFKKEVVAQLDDDDDVDDYRPYFTYYMTTTQIVILIISLVIFGFGPTGFGTKRHTSQVMTTNLALQNVDYLESKNFWIGNRPADLIRLGAKYAPCMRDDPKIGRIHEQERELERHTACCIRNDRSGCVQTTRDRCSALLSKWQKWDSSSFLGPPLERSQRRLSGTVCGQDPRYCEEPASSYPYEWADDITRWPICRHGPMAANNAPHNHHPTAQDAHMGCEVVGRPCCVGVKGECRITTREYCDFVHGTFHEEANLCAQVSCLKDVCGMVPFLFDRKPDQWYRLFTPLFLHAGVFHIIITIAFQMWLMRDFERLVGWFRLACVFFGSGLLGNLVSAILSPERAEVGPSAAHFGILACFVVEIIAAWDKLEHPWRAFGKMCCFVGVLFVFGFIPWIDNHAHIFGFLGGLLLAYPFQPFVPFFDFQRPRKVLLIWALLGTYVALVIGLLLVFYLYPDLECQSCQVLTCIPFTEQFCNSQQLKITSKDS